jgi:hypothetical protein
MASPGIVQVGIMRSGTQLLKFEECSDEVGHISEVALVWK